MPDREKVIKGLEDIVDFFEVMSVIEVRCNELKQEAEDALVLLKEQKEKMEHLNNITLEYEKEVFRLQTLLKEQEPVKPDSFMDGRVQRFTCKKCGKNLIYAEWGRDNYCSKCGQAVKWSDREGSLNKN